MEKFELLKKFQNLGCLDEVKCAAAYRLYLDLKKAYPNVNYIYNSELNLIYLTGIPSNNESKIYVPITTFDNINLNFIQKIQKCLSKGEAGNQQSIVISLVDSSSTIIHYNMTNGFKEID